MHWFAPLNPHLDFLFAYLHHGGLYQPWLPADNSKVVFWTADRIWVHCPYCSHLGHYRFKGYAARDCWVSCFEEAHPPFRVTYPATFIVDKNKGRLVAIKECLTEFSEQPVGRGALLPSSSNITADLSNAPGIAHALSKLDAGQPASLFVRCNKSGTIRHLKIIESLSVLALNGDNFRTMACLQLGKGYEDHLAMSGWESSGHPDLLWPVQWSGRAMRLMTEVDHVIVKDPTMPNADKQYYACHAEKQLAAYFVNKHVITPSDREKWFPIPSSRGSTLDNEKSVDDTPKYSRNLRLALPRNAVTQAKIFVSRVVCADCTSFIDKVNKTLGVNIVCEVRQVRLNNE